MSNNNLEMMKKLLDEKKKKHSEEEKARPIDQVGKNKQAFNSMKKGGSLNK